MPTHRSFAPALTLAFSIAAVIACTQTSDRHREAREPQPPVASYPIPHGVVCGEATASSLRIWARSDRQTRLHARADAPSGPVHATKTVRLENDFSGAVTLRGLAPATRHEYRVWFSDDASATPPANAAIGHCSTAPLAEVAAAVSLAWGGDLAGQNVCRDAKEGYAIFNAIEGHTLDLFIGVGDMIYADHECLATGRFGNEQVPGRFPRATRVVDYWAHYRYNREDPAFRRLLASTGYIATWDDHEVVDDFGPGRDTRSQPPYVTGASLLPIGRQALFDYHPITPAATMRLYRNFRWGRHVEVFVLDTRQYRDPSSLADGAHQHKSMLGDTQRRWLISSLIASDATWRIVVSSVPISIPTGSSPTEMDGWAAYGTATGYQHELRDIWQTVSQAGVQRLVFLTADVHFATGFAYRPFPSERFVVYELVSGPLSAAFYPRTAVDDTFNPERLFFYGPDDPLEVKTYEQAKRWMNYGRIDVDANGDLDARTINAAGSTVSSLSLRSSAPVTAQLQDPNTDGAKR